jgi:S-adenosyl methyltransferase
VQYLAGEQGIRQFLDIGTGVPTADNTYQVAQQVAAESRIVYADNDPIYTVADTAGNGGSTGLRRHAAAPAFRRKHGGCLPSRCAWHATYQTGLAQRGLREPSGSRPVRCAPDGSTGGGPCARRYRWQSRNRTPGAQR